MKAKVTSDIISHAVIGDEGGSPVRRSHSSPGGCLGGPGSQGVPTVVPRAGSRSRGGSYPSTGFCPPNVLGL